MSKLEILYFKIRRSDGYIIFVKRLYLEHQITKKMLRIHMFAEIQLHVSDLD